MSKTKTIASNPFSYINKQEDGCWIWTAAKLPLGYGVLRSNGKVVKAHRFIYELVKGSIQQGLVLDHLCRVPSCVNPDHLEPVRQQVNVLRSPVAPCALNARKTQCPAGHAYSAENTRLWRGRRICRECHRIRSVAAYQAKTHR